MGLTWQLTLVSSLVALGVLYFSGKVNQQADLSKFSPPNPERLPCAADPREIETAESCQKYNCLWKDSGEPYPKCFQPKDYTGYKISGSPTQKDQRTLLIHLKHDGNPNTPFVRKVIKKVDLEVTMVTDNILRFKLFDPETSRYEVPVKETFELLKNPGPIADPAYEFNYDISKNGHFNFRIHRKGSVRKLFDTSLGDIILTDQFLQIATYTPSDNIYGFGENTHESFKHNLTFETWPMFARDIFPTEGHINLYGVHPFYTCLENDGKAHGVMLLNSNAMEYTLLPAPGIKLTTIGGILDFYMFVGNDPEHVIQLYTSLIGRPFLPPFWALGFQLSKYGYNHLDKLKEVIRRNKDAGIPQDVQHLDIDHMEDWMDFTVCPKNYRGLGDYVQQKQKEDNLRFIVLFDPAVMGNRSDYAPFRTGAQQKVYITWPESLPKSQRKQPDGVDASLNIMFGQVWPPGPVAFPDFFRTATTPWWKQQLQEYQKKVNFDGIWIDMNEPAEFSTNPDIPTMCKTRRPDFDCYELRCPFNKYEDPPYPTAAITEYGDVSLNDRTICMTVRQGDNGEYLHYDVHSLYGWSETVSTYKAALEFMKERPMILTRSSYVSSGRYSGHWLGDNYSRWVDLHRSIIGMLEFNLFGIPYIGADICGFNDETNEEMCTRWQQLGAFYPFSRNHNMMGMKDQDPAVFSQKAVQVIRRQLLIRYRLLPYLYTLFFRAHTLGSTVITPLFHYYPRDPATYGLDKQFMWGPSLLVAPVLEKGQKELSYYIPEGLWYDYYYTKNTLRTKGEYVLLKNIVLENPTPLLVRGGVILPTQELTRNTAERFSKPFDLLVFPENKQASGDLFWDDGVSKDTVKNGNYDFFVFHLQQCKLTIGKSHVNKNPLQGPMLLRSIILHGTTKSPQELRINGKPAENGIQINHALTQVDGFKGPMLKVNFDLKNLSATSNRLIVEWETEGGGCEMF